MARYFDHSQQAWVEADGSTTAVEMTPEYHDTRPQWLRDLMETLDKPKGAPTSNNLDSNSYIESQGKDEV